MQSLGLWPAPKGPGGRPGPVLVCDPPPPSPPDAGMMSESDEGGSSDCELVCRLQKSGRAR